tara:strand:- start:3793 stop:4272 length:480 start_codon:yes stop_codon:yes gene_type:complete
MELAIFKQFEAGLAELKNECNFLPDASNDDGYEKSKRIYLDNRSVLKRIDDAHKEAKKPHLDAGRIVDQGKKDIRAKVEAILEPHKIAYQAVDNIEKERAQKELDAALQAYDEKRRKDAKFETVKDFSKLLPKEFESLAPVIVKHIILGMFKHIQFKEQ